jgi:hypothetical protein
MCDLCRAERAGEIRQMSSDTAALLSDVLATRSEQSRQLESPHAQAGSSGTQLDPVFAELDTKAEQITRLLQQVVDKD